MCINFRLVVVNGTKGNRFCRISCRYVNSVSDVTRRENKAQMHTRIRPFRFRVYV